MDSGYMFRLDAERPGKITPQSDKQVEMQPD